MTFLAAQLNISRSKRSIIAIGDALDVVKYLPSKSIQCVITSPPYWGLRDYKNNSQIGLEDTLGEYILKLRMVFSYVKRALKDNGTLWLNLGDGYTSGNRKYRAPDKKYSNRAMKKRPDTPNGLKEKDLLGIPWKVAFALQEDGWYLRTDIIWHKSNAMPETAKDRPSRNHEYLFLFSKSKDYYFASDGLIDTYGKTWRTVWNIQSTSSNGTTVSTLPSTLIKTCLSTSTRPGNWVLDPFFGSGSVGQICEKIERKYLGIEVNSKFARKAAKHLNANIISTSHKDRSQS